jgi:site-specific DNA-methyltransferase (adenine-specific)
MIYKNITDIKANPKNPRLIKDEKFAKLVKSLQDFPEMLEKRPLVCVTDVDGKIYPLGGNMRLKAAQELKMKTLPVVMADEWTAEQRNEFVIKDNVGFGEWNWNELQSDWDVEQLGEWGLDIPADFAEEEVLEAQEDEFNGVPPKEPITVLGDLYEIGEHRLLCGDSTQTDTFEKLMQGELADMVVTDPPYNVNYEGSNGLKIENDNMEDSTFYQFLYDFFTACNTFLKNGSAWYVWHADLEGINFRTAFKNSGIKISSCLIWNKNALVMGRFDYHWKHEPCLYGWKEGAAHKWYSDRKQTTIINYDKPQRNGEHPTMKPIGLFAYQISNSSKSGDIVIDAFGGSGTTMVACDQLKRKGRLIEFDPKYCDVIVARMIKLNKESGTGNSLVIKRNGQQLSDKEVEAFIENTNG